MHHESHTLQAIMKSQFTSSTSMASTALPTSQVGQGYNSTIQLDYKVSNTYFAAWNLALFVLSGIAAVGVVFCIFRQGEGIGTMEESV
jgi:hypothetical protein